MPRNVATATARRPKRPDADLRRAILEAATAIFRREHERALRDARIAVRKIVRGLRRAT